MKLICNSRKLTEAFSLVASVAPARSPKAILRNVKLTAVAGQVVLTATDLEIGIRVTMTEDVDVAAEGTVLLPTQRVRAILQENTGETIAIESIDNQTRITADRSNYRLPSENPDEFPNVDQTLSDSYIEVPARLLSTMIRRTEFATDMESSRYALGGVNLEIDGSTLIAVGTDGRRLAVFSGDAVVHGETGSLSGTTIVPGRAATLIDRAIGQRPNDVVRLRAGASSVTVESDGVLVYSRLLEGRYPNWRQVVPKREASNLVNVVAGPLHVAVRQTAIACDRESRGIDMTFSESNIRMEAKTADIGESSVELPAAGDFTEEGTVKLRVDHLFLADFLKVIDAEATVTMDMEKPSAPLVLRTEDGYQYVIMPMSNV